MSRRERPTVADAIPVRIDFEDRSAVGHHGDDVHLLWDIVTIFRQRNADRLRTSVLIDSLSAIEGRPWSGMSSECLGHAQKLARLLRPLHIRPKTIRFNEGIAKGYLRRWFENVPFSLAEIVAAGARWS
jgi:Protein of unknown function (DUF3631)